MLRGDQEEMEQTWVPIDDQIYCRMLLFRDYAFEAATDRARADESTFLHCNYYVR